MSEHGIPAKLIMLCAVTLSNSCSSVQVRMDLTEPFHTVRGFRQGDPLSCDLFNFRVFCERREYIAMALFLNKASSRLSTLTTLTSQSVPNEMLLCLQSQSTRRESTKMGLAVNEGKTRYVLSTSKDVQHIDSQITADKSRNLFISASTLPPKIMSVWR